MSNTISVITTVYNCENYITESIESILSQTFREFEYIIVDDGSTDSTNSILKKFSGKDERIKLLENKKNKGRVNSLNNALNKANGKYIAIHDADDISHPDRLKKQYHFLETNQDHVLIGSCIDIIDNRSKLISEVPRPGKNLEAKFRLLFRCSFANPSIMYRKKTIDDNNIRYEEYFPAEDFRIISLISIHGNVANLPDKLVMYRSHETNNSLVNSDLVTSHSISIVKDNLFRLGFDVSKKQTARIRKLITSRGIEKDFLYEDVKLIFRIIKTFQKEYKSHGNKEILKTLKRMINWLGRRNIVTKSKYFSLLISILTYYYKESIFVKIKQKV